MIEGISITVRWVAQPGACPKCSALNDREWVVEDLEEAEFIFNSLEHPNGKCMLDVEIDVDLERLQIG